MSMDQIKQSEWHEQWSLLQDNDLSLFLHWIHPMTLEDFRGKTVLEAGCGGGQHTAFMAEHARSVTAVDLNTVDLARERTKDFSNVRFVEADVAAMELGEEFDVVLSIGVVHHTDDPEATVKNLVNHLKPGGRLLLWVYSKEGNFLVGWGVEPFRKLFLRHLPRPVLLGLSRLITACLYLPVYTLYLAPLRFLPYYEYFEIFRSLTFERNVLNVFDKLNAPQVQLLSRDRVLEWRAFAEFMSFDVVPSRGVSWKINAVRSADAAPSGSR